MNDAELLVNYAAPAVCRHVATMSARPDGHFRLSTDRLSPRVGSGAPENRACALSGIYCSTLVHMKCAHSVRVLRSEGIRKESVDPSSAEPGRGADWWHKSEHSFYRSLN